MRWNQQEVAVQSAIAIAFAYTGEIGLLRRHYNNLKAGNFTQADAVESVILNTNN
jgi:hypothetical protein